MSVTLVAEAAVQFVPPVDEKLYAIVLVDTEVAGKKSCKTPTWPGAEEFVVDVLPL